MDTGERGLTEPVPIDDDLCSELSLIEDLDFGARFVISAQQTIYESGQQVTAVKRKIVLTDRAIRDAFDMTGRWLARRAGRKLLQLVK